MQVPNINPLQYGDAGTMVTAFSQLASGIGDFTGKIFSAGLVRPDVCSFGVTGLVLGWNLPSPFGVLFGTGRFATAHGLLTNMDSHTGTSDFTSLVPTGATSITAYLVATYSGVYQSPISIPGPPQGNPGYNPNYAGAVGYTVLRDTLVVSATTSAPDNSSQGFELNRFTLTSATVALTQNTQFQVLASVNKCNNITFSFGTSNLTAANAANLIILSGSTVTLPAISGCDGLVFSFVNISSGASIVQTTGENINGFWSSPSGSVSASIPQWGALTLGGIAKNQLYWQVVGGNLIGQGFSNYVPNTIITLPAYTGSSGFFTVPVTIPGQNTIVEVKSVGAGGGGAGGLGGGGGGGGACVSILSLGPGAIIPYTLGAGGVSGGPGGGNGGNGGTTTFGVGITGQSASGGNGGSGTATLAAIQGGGGGNALGGQLNFFGTAGNGNILVLDTQSNIREVGGGGGANGLGQEGSPAVSLASNIINQFIPGIGGIGGGLTGTSGYPGNSGAVYLKY